ncbi:MAG: 50S ribosomal protein L6 [Candidatus Moeniiplasma glomeromycotorum]|nr:50S ribosomal protein L6 [Candidatus Moeniiplasma glomeromycotorum]MCE8167062.1 50S ribosomal protein L6 [Candidatus Moeniiplasma glomeromycotorum]MCE8168926.1 50S ribosomal protein L6 [Candidatus Moeniiplasma glomeromycotorum]
MSRIANRIIEIPPQVEINLNQKEISVKGSLGVKGLLFPSELKITRAGNQLFTKSENTALAGTYNSLITNLIEGVTKGHHQILEVERSGCEVTLESEKRLKFVLAKIKPDYIQIPPEIKVKVENNRKITLEGVDKQLVGELAAKIKSLNPPSKYYIIIKLAGEKIKLKKRKVAK